MKPHHEGVRNLLHDVALRERVPHLVVFDHVGFADRLHRVQQLSLLVLNQEDLTKSSLSDLLLDIEVTQGCLNVLLFTVD